MLGPGVDALPALPAESLLARLLAGLGPLQGYTRRWRLCQLPLAQSAQRQERQYTGSNPAACMYVSKHAYSNQGDACAHMHLPDTARVAQLFTAGASAMAKAMEAMTEQVKASKHPCPTCSKTV